MTDAQRVMHSLKNLVDACTRCPFDGGGEHRAAHGSGSDTRVIFVSDAPPSTDRGAMHVEGPSELLCLQARKQANLQDAYSTYLVKCRISGEIPTALQFAKCIDFLRREIELLRPQVVVTVGKEVRINDNGKMHTLDFPGLLREFLPPKVTVTWTHDPAYIFSQKKKHPSIVDEYFRQHSDIPAMLEGG